MRRFFKKIHLWLSVPFGIVITLICFSGATLVFEKEITALCYSDIRSIDKPAGEPMPVDVIAASVARTLPEGVRVTGVTVSSDPTEAYQVSLSKPRRASIYVNQYTGEIKGRQERPAFFATMFSLHRWLLDTGKPEGRPAWGKIIVGISTIMFVVALVSGIVIWWPKTRKALRNSLKLTLRKGRFRLWHSLHVAGGMYVIVLLLAMALTGLTWSFAWYRSAFYAVFGVEQSQGGGSHGGHTAGAGRQDKAHGGKKDRKGQRGERGDGTARPAVWQKVYDNLHAANPDSPSITVSDGTATVDLGGFGNSRATDRYTFDKRTGHITSVTRYADSAPSGKLRGWIYSVHAGTFGGLVTRILWFLAALLGASLPLTGYYLWIRRLTRGSRREASVKA